MATKKRLGPRELGIDLREGTDAQAFRWLVACELFGARISQEIAARAYHELDQLGVLSAQKLANADWQKLVDALGRGGYRRYDESTARGLIKLGRKTVDDYGGHISRLRRDGASKKAIEERVQQFPGIGPTAARIFIREIAPAWNL